MISGGMSALAWVKACHRGIILKDVAEGPPPAANGEPLDMRPFYDVALKPAQTIMKRVHEETTRRL